MKKILGAYKGEIIYGEDDGPSLLDHFASLAMQGMMSNSNRLMAITMLCNVSGEDPMKVCAQMSYAYARAMLAEREKPENKLEQ